MSSSTVADDTRGMLGDESESGSEKPVWQPLFQRGSTVSRYVLLDPLGRGGMGMVWRAYDPDLDRNVAIKFVLPGFGEQGRVRMQREARALGKLSHPNVVVVYDVGVLDERVWVAMALIKGVTLVQWLIAAPRTPTEIIGVFVQAGRGLAAAHAEGITHRDFKPANVMVGNDGLVRVMDFGLARADNDVPLERARKLASEATPVQATPLGDTELDLGSGGNSNEITTTGTVLGTPPYMAPEQARGETADARSDQFSFCTSLYETLYGVRLFDGRTIERYFEVAERSPLPGTAPPGSSSEVRTVLCRGLRLDPQARFADMDSLLVALEHAARPPTRRRGTLLGLAAAGLLGGLLLFASLSNRASSCEVDPSILADVWNPSIAAELRDAALQSKLPYAASTWATVEHSLDDWTQRWSRSRERACEASNVESEQSSDMLERRYACLDLQLIRVESTISQLRVLEQTPQELLERLSQISLPGLDGCEAAYLLESEALIPTDEASASEAAAIRTTLAAAEGLLDVGEYPQALVRAEEALERASELDFEPVTAEARLLTGLALYRSLADDARTEELLREAVLSGQRSGHEAVIVRSAAASAAVASRAGKPELAVLWAELARAALLHHGDAPDIEPEVRRHLGWVELTAGNYEAGIVEYGRALELVREREGERSHDYIAGLQAIGDAQRELGRYDEASETLGRARSLAIETLGAKHPMVSNILDSLANVATSRGQHEPALELHLQALAINEEVFGEQHRQIAKNLNNISIIYSETGLYAESIVTLERARAILVQDLGADHPDVAFVDVNLGAGLHNLGRDEEALRRYEAAIPVLERSLGPEHMSVGVTWLNAGVARAGLGDHDGALEAYARAREVLVHAFGDTHPLLAQCDVNRAESLRALGRHEEALAVSALALAMREKIFGRSTSDVVEVLVGMAESELALGHAGVARELGERALPLVSDAISPLEQAQAQFVLAQALVADNPDALATSRAKTLASEAVALLAEAQNAASKRAEIEAWLLEVGQ